MPHPRPVLERLGGMLAAVEDGILVSLLAAMIGLAGTQILLRNLWDTSIGWGDPLLRVTVLWLGLLGAMAATRDDNHINIDLVSRYLSGPPKRAAGCATALFSAVVCALVGFHAARFVQFDWAAGAQAFGAVPAWVCELIVPVGFGIMALRFSVASIRALTSKVGADP